MDNALLDPRNDLVFKMIFAKSLFLLTDLINALRCGQPPIVVVKVINPRIEPEDLRGKHVILDILAKDRQGCFFNIEMQIRDEEKWSGRSIYYLAKTFAGQLKSGNQYSLLKPVVGIHLLAYDLFEEPDQALWCFEMRDRKTPLIKLGSELELNIIELRKADRLARAGKLPECTGPAAAALMAWIMYFEHWKDEDIMNQINYPPVAAARKELKALSADDETRRRVEARERALITERMEIDAAMKRGMKIGEVRGEARGEARGLEKAVKSMVESGMTEAQARSILGL